MSLGADMSSRDLFGDAKSSAKRGWGVITAAVTSLAAILLVVTAQPGADIQTAVESGVREGADGLFLTSASMFGVERVRITGLAARHRLPAIYPLPSHVIDADGLIGVRPFSRTGRLLTIDQGAGPCRSKAHGSSSHPQSRVQEAGRAGVRRRGDPEWLGP